MDVGCALGYMAARLVSLWAPQTRLSPATLYQSLYAERHGSCGPCAECSVATNASKAATSAVAGAAKVTMHCFEPSVERAQLLAEIPALFFNSTTSTSRHRRNAKPYGTSSSSTSQAARQQPQQQLAGSSSGPHRTPLQTFPLRKGKRATASGSSTSRTKGSSTTSRSTGGSSAKRSTFHVHNIALGNAPGLLPYSLECGTLLVRGGGCKRQRQMRARGPGLEDGLYDNDMSDDVATQNINMTAVDIFMQQNRIKHIDLLRIDVGGWELSVIAGARRALSNSSIGVLYFEHRKARWVAARVGLLKEAVASLKAFGYSCFMDGKPQVTRLTGCWHEGLDALKQRLNVLCVARGHVLSSVLDDMSLLHVTNKGRPVGSSNEEAQRASSNDNQDDFGTDEQAKIQRDMIDDA